MVPPRSIILALGVLLCGRSAQAQTVINSTFLDRAQWPAVYSDPNNWSPPGVPNDTVDRHYNATIDVGHGVFVDRNTPPPTISNLTLGSSLPIVTLDGRSLTVAGTTTNKMVGQSLIEVFAYDDGPPVKFDAGTLSTFSNQVLSGNYTIFSAANEAILQFNGANIAALSGSLSITGSLSKVVDEFGNDALRNLARIDSTGALRLLARSAVTNAPLRNDGTLYLYNGTTPVTFVAAAGLTNFDSPSRTLTGGIFQLIGDTAGHQVELRFPGADIVNLGSSILLQGTGVQIVDLVGNDGLRNLARILPAGELVLIDQSRTIAGPLRNDGVLSLTDAACTITTLANFDASTRTLSGGIFNVGDSTLKFGGADIVHNGASITLSGTGNTPGTIQDLTGADGLRNFNDNLSGASFTVGNNVQFTASGDFTNAGHIETLPFIFHTRFTSPAGHFNIPPGHNYTQTAGSTVDDGYLAADRVDILGGTLSGRGTVTGDVTIQNATFSPSVFMGIQGNLTLQAGAHFRYTLDFNEPNQITGKATLAGILEIDVPASRFLSSTTLLTVLQSAKPLSGSFSNAPNGARITTVDGKGSMRVTYSTTAVTLFDYRPEPPPAQLLNISSRAFLSATSDDPLGDRSVLIGGFIITGIDHKDIVVRALGPSLAQYGLDPVLGDPTLELRSASGALIASNDNWKENESQITGAGLAPSDNREAALRASLGPGTYTVVVREKNGLAGSGLVEIYDLSQNSASKVSNISTRGFIDASNVLIGGIIAAGPGQANADIVARALGPELRSAGVANALDDPTLEVRDINGVVVGFNDDWSGDYSDPVNSTGLTPDPRESAMYLSLPRGNYTAIVRGKANSSGVATVEFYDLRH